MKKISLFMFVIVFLSCKENNDGIVNNNVMEFSMPNNNYVTLDCIFEEFQVVPLENNQDCMLSDVRRLFVKNNKVYVYDQNGIPSIHRFNIDGSYDRKVGDIGHGKNEYFYVKDVTVTDDERIIILSALGKIQIFNSDCMYEKTIELEENLGFENVVSGGNFYIFSSKHTDYSENEKSLLYFFDENFNLIDQKVDRIPKHFSIAPFVNIPLDCDGEQCCFFDFFRNQFFIVQLDKLHTLNIYSVKTDGTYDIDDALKGNFENNGNWCDIITDEFFLDNKILGWMIYDGRRCFFEYDVNTGLSYIYRYSGLSPNVMCYYNDTYYTVLDPQQLLSYIEKNKESDSDNILYKALMKYRNQIKMTDNFYLIKMKHKKKIESVPIELL